MNHMNQFFEKKLFTVAFPNWDCRYKHQFSYRNSTLTKTSELNINFHTETQL